jgi:DMSO/TMAO reductase YedYZ molybdopterin-dependent catalytic subunit
MKEWKGVKLSEILKNFGVEDDSEYKHVHFIGLDHDEKTNYGASIPIIKATNKDMDVILAVKL